MSRELQAREIEQASSVLLYYGVQTIKKNPIKTSLYLLGLGICILFSGFKINAETYTKFQQKLNDIDLTQARSYESELYTIGQLYRRSQGWFTCDSNCQQYKIEYNDLLQKYNNARKAEDQQVSQAKNIVGIFSEYGVGK